MPEMRVKSRQLRDPKPALRPLNGVTFLCKQADPLPQAPVLGPPTVLQPQGIVLAPGNMQQGGAAPGIGTQSKMPGMQGAGNMGAGTGYADKAPLSFGSGSAGAGSPSTGSSSSTPSAASSVGTKLAEMLALEESSSEHLRAAVNQYVPEESSSESVGAVLAKMAEQAAGNTFLDLDSLGQSSQEAGEAQELSEQGENGWKEAGEALERAITGQLAMQEAGEALELVLALHKMAHGAVEHVWDAPDGPEKVLARWSGRGGPTEHAKRALRGSRPAGGEQESKLAAATHSPSPAREATPTKTAMQLPGQAPMLAGEDGRTLEVAPRRRRSAATGIVGWLPGTTDDVRVLAGAPEPDARSDPVPAGRIRVGHRTPGPVVSLKKAPVIGTIRGDAKRGPFV